MEKNVKLVLHIGTEKTGSTSIQGFLKANERRLYDEGFYLPRVFEFSAHIEAPLYCKRSDRYDDIFEYINADSIEDKNRIKKKFRRTFVEELSKLPKHIHTVIISSELFHSRLIYQDEVNRIKELTSPFFDQYQIIVYLRSQIDLAVSVYSTYLREGLVDSYEDTNELFRNFCRPERSFYNYDSFLSRWERVFGHESMSVRLFEVDRFYGKNLLLDFLYTLSPGLVDTFEGVSVEKYRENRSLNETGQRVLNMINQYIPRDGGSCSSLLHHELAKVVNHRFHGQGKRPDHPTAVEIMESFYGINEKIRERYFPNEQLLFEESLEKYGRSERNCSTVEELYFFEYLIKRLSEYEQRLDERWRGALPGEPKITRIPLTKNTKPSAKPKSVVQFIEELDR